MNTDLTKLLNSSTGQAPGVTASSEGLNIESLLAGESKSAPSEIDELISELLENVDGLGEGDANALQILLAEMENGEAAAIEGTETVESSKLSKQLKNILDSIDGKISLNGNLEEMSAEEKELVLQKVKEVLGQKNAMDLKVQNLKNNQTVQTNPLKLINGGDVGHSDLIVNKNKILNGAKVNQEVSYFGEASVATAAGLHPQLAPQVDNAGMQLNLKNQVAENLTLETDVTKAQIIDKIAGHIAKMNVAGKESFDFRVDHRELGQIDINVQKLSANDINLKIQTANPEAFQILTENKNDLFSHLKATGIRVFDYSLDMGQPKMATSNTAQGQFDSQHSGKEQNNDARNPYQQQQGDDGRKRRDDLWDLLRDGRTA